MIIRAIRLQNFLCYYGENEIAFSEGLNLILGANGFGKSKLYDAFYWVFEDYIFNTETGEPEKTSIVKSKLVCDKAKAECEVGENITASVEIEVEHTNKQTYRLKRSYNIKKTSENQFIEPLKSETNLFYKDVLHFKPTMEDFKEKVEKLIPSSTRPYVWFKGERGIENLINTTDERSLREVIERLSNISRWENYKKITEKAAETASADLIKQRNTNKKEADKIANLERQKNNLEKEIERLEKYIEDDEKNRAIAEEEQEKYLAKKDDASRIKEIHGKLSSAKKQYEITKKEYEKKDMGFTSQLFDRQWVLLGLDEYITEFGKKLKNYEFEKEDLKRKQTGKESKFKLPANIPDPIKLQEMLDKGICFVCNQPIAEHSEAYHFVKEKMNYKEEITKVLDSLNNHDDFFRQLRNNALRLETVIQDVPQDMTEYRKEIGLWQQQAKIAEEEVNRIENELSRLVQSANIEEGQADNIMTNYHKAKDRTNRLISNIATNEEKLKNEENELKRIEEELHKLTKDDSQVLYFERVKAMLEDIKAIAHNTKDRFYQQLIQELEDKANQHFTNINNIGGAFVGKIKFQSWGKGFKPKIMSNGIEVFNSNTSNLSAMKLSIIMAIISAKDRNAEFYPLIADAPVSDFDEVKTIALLNEIGNTFTQSIILFKDLLKENKNPNSQQDIYIVDDEALNDLRQRLPKDKPIVIHQLFAYNNSDVDNRAGTYTKIQKVREL
jgi:DNA sulfur modification protein DndD